MFIHITMLLVYTSTGSVHLREETWSPLDGPVTPGYFGVGHGPGLLADE
jgi:hypothetical protein